MLTSQRQESPSQSVGNLDVEKWRGRDRERERERRGIERETEKREVDGGHIKREKMWTVE